MQARRLSTIEAAQYLGSQISPRSLEAWRVRGGGPVYCRLGKKCVYDIADLDAWVASKRRASTSASAPPSASESAGTGDSL